MINILILADHSVGGGAETQLIEEMAILQNISNLFFISASEVSRDDLPSRVTYLGMLSQNSKEPLLAEVAIRKINIVHLHNVWHPCWYGFLRQLSLPKVMTLHDYRLVCPSGWQVRPKEVTRCKNRGIIACTTSGCLTKNHRRETGATYFWWLYAQYLKTNVSVFLTTNMDLILELQKEGCTNVTYVNLPMINPPSFSTHKRERLVIFAGNLGVHKGVHRLILTIKAVCELDRSIRFIFAGDGKLREYLQTEIEGSKIDNVKVLGFIQRPALIELLGTAALTYLPSKWQENFNLVSRESRLVGTPVLVPATAGYIGRLKLGVSQYFSPQLIDHDAVQIVQIVNARNGEFGSFQDRKEEILTCSVDRFLSAIHKTYLSAGISLY